MTKSNPDGDGTLNNPFEVGRDNYNWIDNMQPGDLYYFRDGEIYDGNYNGGQSNIWIRSSEPSGTASSPISLLAYPGEKPMFVVPTVESNFNRSIQFSNQHMVFSGFSIDSEHVGANMAGDFLRFIGNDVIGVKNKYGSGTGIINSGNLSAHSGDGNKFFGNAIHGGNSKDRFDHALYVSGCSDDGGVEVGWNHFFDNDFGRGPIIVVNHQQDRCDVGQILDAHFIFNNIVDCNAQRSRAIGVYDLSYDDGEEAPEPTYVYNNVIISCGTFDGNNTEHIGWAPAMYQSARGTAHFYNNTLYNSGYTGFSIGERATKSSIRNNIIHMTPDVPGATGNHYVAIDDESVVTLSNNLFFGLGEYSRCAKCPMDQDNVNNEDPLFVDPENQNFQLQDASPALDAGSANLELEIDLPGYAPIDRDLNFVLRSGSPAIGAYEPSSTTVSFDQVDESTTILLYPNPVANNLTLEIDLVNPSTVNMAIYDALGKLVGTSIMKKYPTGKNMLSVATDNLKSGMYYLLVSTERGKSGVRKFVVE